jgi:hypothetical protein
MNELGGQADPPTLVEQPERTATGPSDVVDPGPYDPIGDLDATAGRIAELRLEGHGPARHLDPSDAQLQQRLGTPVVDDSGQVVLRPDGYVRSTGHVDPMTGTTTDGVHGGVHHCGPFATRFDSPDDFVRAEAYLRAQSIRDDDPLPRVAIADVLGPDGESRMTGYYHNPDGSGGYRRVDFDGGTIAAAFDGTSDALTLRTMYIQPRQ